MFSHSVYNMRNFISQSIMASVRAIGLFKANEKSSRPCTHDVKMSFVNSSCNLLRRTGEKCHESGSARRKAAKEIFFFHQGYTNIFPPQEIVPMFSMSNGGSGKRMRLMKSNKSSVRPIIKILIGGGLQKF